VRVRAQELGLITNNETRRFGFHAMRHGLASFLVGQGVDPKTVQGLLRHARASTTLNLYVHEVEDAKIAAQDLAAAAMLETPEVVQ
jgi:integrase